MKVNITFDEDNNLNGYLNISPNQLSSVDDGEADEVRAIDVLPYFPEEESANLLMSWIKKLRHGGHLIIGALDIYEVAPEIAY